MQGPRHIREALRILKDIGCDIEIEQNKHAKVRVAADGGSFTWTVATTPSDYRSMKNAFAQLRRQLRDIGIEPPRHGLRGTGGSHPVFDELWLLLDTVESEDLADGDENT